MSVAFRLDYDLDGSLDDLYEELLALYRTRTSFREGGKLYEMTLKPAPITVPINPGERYGDEILTSERLVIRSIYTEVIEV